MKYYELDFVEMEDNRVTRDFRHFTDENEAKQMFNDLKGNPEIVRVTRNELFKGDGKNYLGGSEERERFVNSEPEMHRMFLNSRLGDKRFIAEPVTDYFGRRNRARKRFLQFEPVREMKPGDAEDVAKKRFDRLTKDDQTKLLQIMKMMDKEKKAMDEADLTKGEKRKLKDMSKSLKKSSKGHAGQAKYLDKLVKERNDAFSGYFSKTNLGRMIIDAEEILDSGMQNGEPLTNETEMLVRQELKRLKQLYIDNHGYTGMMASAEPTNEEKSTSIEKIYMDMLKNELPSQDEVNDAFEKFERETHYLNNKPVGEWDAMDMSNWKSILRKNGKLFMSVKESMARYRVSYTKKDSSKSSIDYISGLNAEDEFYELMNDDNIISAKVEYIGGDEYENESTWTRGDDGKIDVKIN